MLPEGQREEVMLTVPDPLAESDWLVVLVTSSNSSASNREKGECLIYKNNRQKNRTKVAYYSNAVSCTCRCGGALNTRDLFRRRN